MAQNRLSNVTVEQVKGGSSLVCEIAYRQNFWLLGFFPAFNTYVLRRENILKLFNPSSCNRRGKSVESVRSKGSCAKQNYMKREQLNFSEMRVIYESSVKYEIILPSSWARTLREFTELIPGTQYYYSIAEQFEEG